MLILNTKMILKLTITLGNYMNYVITIMLAMVMSSLAFADHHSLTLEARQARTELTITSLDLGDEVSVITAEADMGE